MLTPKTRLAKRLSRISTPISYAISSGTTSPASTPSTTPIPSQVNTPSISLSTTPGSSHPQSPTTISPPKNFCEQVINSLIARNIYPQNNPQSLTMKQRPSPIVNPPFEIIPEVAESLNKEQRLPSHIDNIHPVNTPQLSSYFEDSDVPFLPTNCEQLSNLPLSMTSLEEVPGTSNKKIDTLDMINEKKIDSLEIIINTLVNRVEALEKSLKTSQNENLEIIRKIQGSVNSIDIATHKVVKSQEIISDDCRSSIANLTNKTNQLKDQYSSIHNLSENTNKMISSMAFHNNTKKNAVSTILPKNPSTILPKNPSHVIDMAHDCDLGQCLKPTLPKIPPPTFKRPFLLPTPQIPRSNNRKNSYQPHTSFYQRSFPLDQQNRHNSWSSVVKNDRNKRLINPWKPVSFSLPLNNSWNAFNNSEN